MLAAKAGEAALFCVKDGKQARFTPLPAKLLMHPSQGLISMLRFLAPYRSPDYCSLLHQAMNNAKVFIGVRPGSRIGVIVFEDSRKLCASNSQPAVASFSIIVCYDLWVKGNFS